MAQKKTACEIAGKEIIHVLVRKYDDEATISNGRLQYTKRKYYVYKEGILSPFSL